jgi:hypothetical protein
VFSLVRVASVMASSTYSVGAPRSASRRATRTPHRRSPSGFCRTVMTVGCTWCCGPRVSVLGSADIVLGRSDRRASRSEWVAIRRAVSPPAIPTWNQQVFSGTADGVDSQAPGDERIRDVWSGIRSPAVDFSNGAIGTLLRMVELNVRARVPAVSDRCPAHNGVHLFNVTMFVVCCCGEAASARAICVGASGRAARPGA